jgi:hypothetical protein
LGKALKKSCVLVKDAPAFVVNRLYTRLMSEVTRALDEGHAGRGRRPGPGAARPADVAVRAAAARRAGRRAARGRDAAQRFPDRFHVSVNLRRIVEAGKPGIYSWNDKGRPYVADDIAALLELGDAPKDEAQVREVALRALAQEARLMLDEGVVAAPQDLDLCMLLGAGWPFHLGGLTPYLDRTGIAERSTASASCRGGPPACQPELAGADPSGHRRLRSVTGLTRACDPARPGG